MAFLAIETSSTRGSLALFEEQRLLAESFFPEGLIHGREIAPRIQAVLQAAGLVNSSLEGVCVSLGPGSFTGLRVGVTAAKSLAYALRIPVVGASSLAVLAAARLEDAQGPDRILTLIDGRKGLFYGGAFEVGGHSAMLPQESGGSPASPESGSSGGIQRLLPDGLYSREELLLRVASLWSGARPRISVFGEGADAFLASSSHGLDLVRGPTDWDIPKARVLGRLLAEEVPTARFDPEAVHGLEPSYLRLSDAEIRRGSS
jgi:tRNA threonylcarbamoyladenosine biosynthesis protein TsaB